MYVTCRFRRLDRDPDPVNLTDKFQLPLEPRHGCETLQPVTLASQRKGSVKESEKCKACDKSVGDKELGVQCDRVV